jgi:hypothetical protein
LETKDTEYLPQSNEDIINSGILQVAATRSNYMIKDMIVFTYCVRKTSLQIKIGGFDNLSFLSLFGLSFFHIKFDNKIQKITKMPLKEGKGASSCTLWKMVQRKPSKGGTCKREENSKRLRLKFKAFVSKYNHPFLVPQLEA